MEGVGMVEIPNELTNYEEITRLVRYEDWFSDQIARNYMNSFLKRLAHLDARQDIEQVKAEMEGALNVYSALVYLIYPNSSELQQKIDSSKEHSGNFRVISEWLSQNGGEERAQRFLEAVKIASDA
jgi:hypothetical protein